jgi:hypothetical protein
MLIGAIKPAASALFFMNERRELELVIGHLFVLVEYFHFSKNLLPGT